MAPERIVYVSCDSATLSRDLKFLCEKGFKVEKVQPVDMFPHTVHVETVVLLSQQKPDDHIEIEINLDEIDATSAESKATYKEIEEWVQEHYGFHVTNLNIAQVKQKHGIIERENYNKPKSENSRQPGCPEEKVKAIEEALKHFQMI
jgi:23S rRNA (uracil1939-C5)-methyltransferase